MNPTCVKKLYGVVYNIIMIAIIIVTISIHDREVHRSSLRRFMCPAQDHFMFPTLPVMSRPMTSVLALTRMLVLVCDVYQYTHTPFHLIVGLCGRKFVPCLFGQCPGPCITCLSWQHARVLHLARLLLKRSRCLVYAAQPAMILRCISLSWFFS